MGCSKKKFWTERLPTSMIPSFSCFQPRMSLLPAALLETRTLCLSGRLDHLPGRRLGTAHAHDAREPARLRKRFEHQDQEDRERRRKKGAWSAEQPRPEDKPDE